MRTRNLCTMLIALFAFFAIAEGTPHKETKKQQQNISPLTKQQPSNKHCEKISTPYSSCKSFEESFLEKEYLDLNISEDLIMLTLILGPTMIF